VRAIAIALWCITLFAQSAPDKPKTYEPTEHQADQLKIKQLEFQVASDLASQYCGSQGKPGSLMSDVQGKWNALVTYGEEVKKANNWQDAVFNAQTGTFAQKPVETKPK
jgi:hypothetical protein